MICTTTEWQTIAGVELSAEQVRQLSLSDAFTVRPDINAPGRWQLTATQFVGMARFDDLEIRVEPKVGVRRLVELLCSTLDRVQWRDEDTMWSESDDLLTTIAATFTTHAERLVQRGLVQGYRTVDDQLLAVRGRIAIGRQVSRNAGLPIPVEVTYDDYTTDVIENQLLAGATRILLRIPDLPLQLRSRLRRLEYRLEDVTAAPASTRPPEAVWTRLNDRYRTAITIARLILRGRALDTDTEAQRSASGFLVDMNKVFEDIVGRGIQSALEPVGLSVNLQADCYLDAERTTKIRPDIVISSEAGPIAVADIKYKAPADRLPTPDLFQAVTYARRFNLDAATLIYASTPQSSQLTIGSTRIHLRHIDLSLTPEERATVLEDSATAVARPLPVT